MELLVHDVQVNVAFWMSGRVSKNFLTTSDEREICELNLLIYFFSSSNFPLNGHHIAWSCNLCCHAILTMKNISTDFDNLLNLSMTKDVANILTYLCPVKIFFRVSKCSSSLNLSSRALLISLNMFSSNLEMLEAESKNLAGTTSACH